MLGRRTEINGWQVAMVLGAVAGLSVTVAWAQDLGAPTREPPALAGPANLQPAAPQPGNGAFLTNPAVAAEAPPPPAEPAPAPAEPVPPAPVAADEGAAGQNQEGAEVLTRGPVHEAFAEPLAADPQAGMIVNKKPPEEIDEVPPDLKPEGDNVAWIPGYWAWDDDRSDFIWVSGIWRNPPPNRRWVPGYWTEAQGGWQWVPGLWVPVVQEELMYHPAPPQTLEAGPSSPAPSDQHFWVPGCWMWYETGYRWRPGFWSPYRDDWVWVPAHWVWTPSGYLFVPGYWDHRLVYRGSLFAPVYFHGPWWRRPRFHYTPWCVVDAGPLCMHFWIRPRYGHYYFGDYYGPHYLTIGFTPWSHWHSNPHHWDPLLMHNQVYFRHHDRVDYVHRMQQWHAHYDKHIDVRPPHTFLEQQKFATKFTRTPNEAFKHSLVAAPLASVAKKPHLPDQRFVSVAKDKRDSFHKEAQQFRSLTRDRFGMEKSYFAGGPAGAKPPTLPAGGSPRPVSKMKLPKPPDTISRVGRDKPGPSLIETPKHAQPREISPAERAKLTRPALKPGETVRKLGPDTLSPKATTQPKSVLTPGSGKQTPRAITPPTTGKPTRSPVIDPRKSGLTPEPGGRKRDRDGGSKSPSERSKPEAGKRSRSAALELPNSGLRSSLTARQPTTVPDLGRRGREADRRSLTGFVSPGSEPPRSAASTGARVRERGNSRAGENGASSSSTPRNSSRNRGDRNRSDADRRGVRD
jgi:hypothetical protein